MNTKTLGDNFMEPRQNRSHSETKRFQDFRTQRNIMDVTDGNRRFKNYNKKESMTGLIENRFGRTGKYL
jgi:hypothetical protein